MYGSRRSRRPNSGRSHRGTTRLADLALCESSRGRTSMADLDLRRRMEHRDPKCDICSDSQETRWHFHYSSNQLRESREKLRSSDQEGRKWFCPICFTNEPIELIPTQTRRIVLTDSSLYGVWKRGLQGKNTLLEIIIEVEYFQAGEGGRASTYKS